MKTEEKHRMGRAEAAERLRRVADMVEQGKVVSGEHSIELPEEFEYELELEDEQSKGKVEVELEWKTPRRDVV